MPYLEVKADYNECKLAPKHPYFPLRLTFTAPGGGACHRDDEYQKAVRARLSWGYELKFTAGKINGEQAVDVTLGVRLPQTFPFVDLSAVVFP